MATNPSHTGGRRAARWGTVAVRDDMIRRYERGLQPLRQIAREMGCSYGTVHLVLTTAGVPMRPRGGARPRPAANPDQPPPHPSPPAGGTAATDGAR